MGQVEGRWCLRTIGPHYILRFLPSLYLYQKLHYDVSILEVRIN